MINVLRKNRQHGHAVRSLMRQPRKLLLSSKPLAESFQEATQQGGNCKSLHQSFIDCGARNQTQSLRSPDMYKRESFTAEHGLQGGEGESQV